MVSHSRLLQNTPLTYSAGKGNNLGVGNLTIHFVGWKDRRSFMPDKSSWRKLPFSARVVIYGLNTLLFLANVPKLPDSLIQKLFPAPGFARFVQPDWLILATKNMVNIFFCILSTLPLRRGILKQSFIWINSFVLHSFFNFFNKSIKKWSWRMRTGFKLWVGLGGNKERMVFKLNKFNQFFIWRHS